MLALGGSLLLRGLVVGRGPWGNMFEFTVAFSFSMIGGYLFLQRRYPIRSIGFIPTGVALALLLYASSLPSEITPLVPALQNAPLLTIHVGMAVLSYGIFATSFAAGVAYLAQGQHDRFGWLPSHKVLDEVAYKAVIIGFPIFATMIILGSWWASIAWSRYWGWDPKETAALVTWLTYAIYLHARNQRSWAGRPAALLLVVALRYGPRHVLGVVVVQRPPRVQRAVGPRGPGRRPRSGRRRRSQVLGGLEPERRVVGGIRQPVEDPTNGTWRPGVELGDDAVAFVALDLGRAE